MTPEQIASSLGGARRDGNGYVALCPCHDDSRASLALHVGDDGRLLWHCRAGCSQAEIRDALAPRGLLVNGHEREAVPRRAPKRKAAPDAEPNMRDAKLGEPVDSWAYRDAGGATLFYTARYDTPEGKCIRPWTFDGTRWRQRAFPAPRPLYGLERLARLPEAPVLIVEGEKCADSGHAALGATWACMTWAGGAAATAKTDWTPLRDRRVLIWPDRDNPGRRAAEQIRSILPQAEVLDVPGDDGWDCADLLDSDGIDAVQRFVAECPRMPAPATQAGSQGDAEVPPWVDEVPPASGAQAHAESAEPLSWPEPLDLAALGGLEPEPPRHIVPGWLPEGEVILLAGHGGSGKSAIALHLGACIALGRPFAGIACERRPVKFVSCEDGTDILHWRLSRISQHMRVALADLCALRVIDASGMHAELMIDPGRGDEPMMTSLFTELAERIEPGSVVIIDGASDVFGASEIVRRHVRRFVRSLRRLAGASGAVLLLAHIDKAAARSRGGSDLYSGSTAWNNTVRARWELQADGETLALRLAKANHARAGAEIRLRWDDSAHMHLPIDAPIDGGIVGSIRERTEREAVLAAIRGCMTAVPPIPVPSALTGRRTTWHVLSERSEFPPALRADDRATKKQFARHLEILRQAGAIEEQSVLTAARHRVGMLVLRDCANHAQHD